MKKGFTLIELIIVISIIALLSVIGISTYSSVQVDARNSKRKSDLKEIKSALELYRSEIGTYPSTAGRSGCPATGTVGDGNWCGLCATYNTGNTFQTTDTDGTSTSTDTGDTGYIPDTAPVYMQQLPVDPRSSFVNGSSGNSGCRTNAGANCYLYNSNGVDYKLLAHCTPEGTMDPNDAFFDPIRPTHAWQVSSSNTSRNW